MLETKTDSVSRQLQEVLKATVSEKYGAGTQIEGLVRLSGGASGETWSFDAIQPDRQRIPLILKRDPLHVQEDGQLTSEASRLGMSRHAEGLLMHLAGEVGVPAPKVLFYLEASERSTEGFISQRLAGETLGRRILREDTYAKARPKLAFQCGHAAARLHSIALDKLPPLKSLDVDGELTSHQDIMRSFSHPYAGFEYGFRWLEERKELASHRHTLVHGDFRNGNIIVDADGLRGVLDWELGHLSNPISDLGWICVRSWRYNHYSKPVGGFGEVEELLAGYEAGGGGKVELEELHFWEVFGTLRWGILCIIMGFQHLRGELQSFERAAIGRRSAETEYDLLQMLD